MTHDRPIPCNLLLPTLMAIGMIGAFSYFSSGLSLIVTFVPGVVLAYGLYLRTCYRVNPVAEQLVPVYFLSLGVQMLHFAEEHYTHFDVAFPRLFGSAAYPHNLFVTFNMGAYLLFIIGGLAIYRGVKPLMFIALFFIACGIVGNAIGHLCFSIAVGGYFPGLWTSLLYWPLGVYTLRQLWRSTRPCLSARPTNAH